MANLTPKFDTSSLNFEAIEADIEAIKANIQKQECILKNTFPVDAFPRRIRKIINALFESLQYPTDYTGAALLYAVSVAIGNTYRVQVKSNWQESALIYIIPVGAPGTAKSHPPSFALAPIFNKDSKSFKIYEINKLEYNYLAGLSLKERKEQGLDEPIKPVWKKHLVQDFTPEALIELLKFNKRGVGVYADELAIWFKNFNRYSKGSDQELWLIIWSGKELINDRKSGEPSFIKLPFVSVLGSIQPAVLQELAKDSRSQNGFTDRCLFAIPESNKKPYWSDVTLSPEYVDDWQTILNSILDLPLSFDDNDNPKPNLLPFTHEAYALLKKWHKNNTDQCNNATTDAIRGIYSKFDIHVIRLSLIMQMLYWAAGEGDKEAVGVEAVQSAITLSKYFKNTALKVQKIISSSTSINSLPTDKSKLYTSLPSTFTTQEGIQIAESEGMIEVTFKRFLKDRELFSRDSHGKYSKLK